MPLEQPTRERTGPIHGSLFGLASDGVYTAMHVTTHAVVSYTAIPPLPLSRRFLFCCTFLGVTPTGRYPASCPAKPGLSSVFQAIVLVTPCHEYIVVCHKNQFLLYVKYRSAHKLPYK